MSSADQSGATLRSPLAWPPALFRAVQGWRRLGGRLTAAWRLSGADQAMRLADAAADTILRLNAAGVVREVSAAAPALFGATAAELVGSQLGDFVAVEDRAALACGLADIAAGSRRVVCRVRLVRPDGRLVATEAVVAPVRGRAGGSVAVLRDVGDRFEQENRLRDAAKMFRRLIDGISDYAISMLDPDGRVMQWSAAAERLLGYTAAEVAGKHVSLFSTSEDIATGVPVRALELAAASGRSEARLWLRRRDGSRFRGHQVINAVRGADGTLIGFAGVTQDVTGRDELEEQLRHAQRLEAVGRLTAGVAHDFNNLLQAQMSSLQLLGDEVADRPNAMELVGLALQTAHRGAVLTHHLLAFSRKQMLTPSEIAAPGFLIGLGHMLPRVLGANIDVQTFTGLDLPALRADRAQLETALLNLAINAGDAMPAGGRLRIEASAAEAPGGDSPAELAPGFYVVLAVSDNGTGMDADTLAHASEPFFTTKGTRGSGLGLSMVLGFAKQSGGDMRIRSTPGQGTRVELWLPSASVPSRAKLAGAPSVRVAGRVLLVDDASDVLATIGAFLTGAGFDVVHASSGERAMVVMNAGERFDILVTDYAMPGLNGAELIRQALLVQPDLQALIITGFAEVSGIENLPQQVQVLRKPFLREQLVERILSLMAARDPTRVA